MGICIWQIRSSFNSLQTGRHIQRYFRFAFVFPKTVFQFPSNGKAYPKQIRRNFPVAVSGVSIPFKREGISKVRILLTGMSEKKCFNSLQTGRHIQRCVATTRGMRWIVSIPFKREGIYKVIFKISTQSQVHVFQFPSNGKAYPKCDNHGDHRVVALKKFQFPSNGKAYPKYI